MEGVETDRGRIESPIVIDAAGAWARQVAAHAGIHVPMVPTRHQVLITEPIEGVRPELPIVRVMDAAVYVRPCWGGFLAGGYESEPTQFDMDRLPKGFSIAETPLDPGVLRRLMDGVREQLPVLDGSVEAPPRRHPDDAAGRAAHRGAGPWSGRLLRRERLQRGRAVHRPAIGEELARWIVDGRPSEDLGAMSIARFGPEWRDEQRLRRAAAWEYWHFYSYDPPSA